MENAIKREYFLLLALKQAGVGVFAATYVTFLLSKGLDLFEVNLVNTVFFVTLFICEIPTGAFADIFGRKTSFVTSCVLYAISLFMYAFSNSLTGFVAAEMLGAIAATFATGALDAWFVDRLNHHGYHGDLRDLFSRGAQISRAVGLLSAIVGALLSDISMAIPWLIGGAIFTGMGVYAAYALKEEYFVRTPVSFKTGWSECIETVRKSVTYGVKNSHVRFVMLSMLILSFATMAPNMQWQPYFKQWVSDQTSLGFIFAGISLSLMAGAWIVPRLLHDRKDSEQDFMILALSLIGASLIAAVSTTSFVYALIAFLLHEVGRGAIVPIKDAYLHDNIPSKERATILSFESIGHHVGGAIGLLVSGAIAQSFSIPYAWTLSGGGLLLAALLLWRRR